jgi:peptidoglycan/LPS O-acetylase OafA/YrhL
MATNLASKANEPPTRHQVADAPARVESVEILRGLAALAVTWFHMTNTHQENWVRFSGWYGWLGVEMFFVISGFVIPLSIHQRYGRFGVRDFVPYMARRLIRLEPPYLISLAMVIVLWEVSVRVPGFAGSPPDYSLPQVLAHVAYAIPLTPYDWLQVVYWTLAYEFVFFLFAGAFFWMLGYPGPLRWPLLVGVTISLSLAGLLPAMGLLFLLGIAVFRRLFLRDRAWITLAVLGLVTIALAHLEQPVHAAVGLGTSLAIWVTARLHFRGPAWRPFFILGALSYSLYLVHVPIGGRFINLFRRFMPDTTLADLILSLGGLVLSLGVAFLFWRLIEQPAIKLARRVGSWLEQRNVAQLRKKRASLDPGDSETGVG